MSSFLYPNSATRKLYGQAGQAMQRQNKRFVSIVQRLEKEARDKELKLRETAEQKFEREMLRMKKIQKRIIIGFVIVVTVLLITFLIFN